MGTTSYFGGVAIIAIIVLLAAIGTPALAEGAEPNAIVNESITVDYNAQTSVNEDGVEYDDTVTITNATGTNLVAGDDYEWNANTGNVTWFNTASTADGEDVVIDYTVHQITDTSLTIAEMGAALAIALSLIGLLVWGTITFEVF